MKIEVNINSLSELRELKGFTQGDVAKKLDITPQGYGLLERGERELKAKVIQKLSHIFDVPMDKIIFLALNNNRKLLSSTGTEGH